MELDKENRSVRFTIRLTESEASQLQKKMDLLGITNTAAYLRAMALNGYILRIDLPEIREMLRLLGNMTNNLNQIARRMNSGGLIYETEIDEIRESQQELWPMMNRLLTRLEGTQ